MWMMIMMTREDVSTSRVIYSDDDFHLVFLSLIRPAPCKQELRFSFHLPRTLIPPTTFSLR